MHKITIQTSKRVEALDVTSKVQTIVTNNRWKDGVLAVFVPHCTAALFVNESEPNLRKDYADFFSRLADGSWAHDDVDDNASAHLLSSLIGVSRQFIIEGGKLQLGTWQSIILLELDGPRERKIWLEFCEA